MKIRAIVDFRVEVEPPHHVTRWAANNERKEKALKEWAREFEAFIRDHRSQDPINLTVIRDERDECSLCGREWEQDEDGPLCCNAAQDEWNAAKEAV